MPAQPLRARMTALSAACLVALSPLAVSAASAAPLPSAVPQAQTTASGATSTGNTAAVTDADPTSGLLVTEIVPNTTGADAFEFFELHNPTEEAIDLASAGYGFSYSYVDSADTSRDVPLAIAEDEGDVVLQPGETVVMWLSYTADDLDSFAHTVDEFREFYGMADANSARVVRVTGQNGMANGGDRGIRVLKDGQVDGWSHYPSGSAAAQKGIHFGRTTAEGQPSRTVVETQATPTPGEVTEDQTRLGAPGEEPEQPGDETEGPGTDVVPPVIVTEILPNTTGTDRFEYFEIHNTTDQAIDLGGQGFSFAYSYVDSDDRSSDVPLDLVEDLTLDAGETAVLWLSYETADFSSFDHTVAEFREFHGIAADDTTPIVRVTGQDGMANGGDRGIRVLENDEISSWSHYPSGSAGVQLGIEFALPTVGGQPSLSLLAPQAEPTPGQVREEQLSTSPVEQPEPEDPFADRTPSQTAAPLVITELVVDSTNVGNADGYEFVEVANTSDQAIDLSDYTLNYLYPDTGSDAVWAAQPSDVLLQPGETLVYWIKNGSNGDLTVEDFNAFHGTELVLGQSLVEVHTGGMANGSARGMQIQTNTGFPVNRGFYNMDGVRDVATDQGLHFGVDPEDLEVQQLWGSADPTPGSLHRAQLPGSPVSLPADTAEPVVEDTTGGAIDPAEPFGFSARITDDVLVRTVTLNLRSNADDAPQQFSLQAGQGADQQDLYSYGLPQADLTGKRWFEYSFTVSDGTQEITSDTQRVSVEGADTAPVRLNLEDGQFLAGTAALIGAADSVENPVGLMIDGTPVETTASLEAEPVFAFETTQTDNYFRNGVLAGGEELHIFDEGTYERTETVSVPVPLHHITDDNTLTASVYAGTKAAPEIDPGENNDDFQIRNPRLILPDGRTLTPRGLEDPQSWMNMGDSAGKLEFYDAAFDLPDDAFTGSAHQWDTTAATDGEHTVSASLGDGGESVSRTVQVDNTGPEISVSGVQAGEPARGPITVDTDITDAGAGIASSAVTLNGEEIELPYETSSVDLPAGEHTIEVSAVDELGNTSTESVTFTTPDENPTSDGYSPADGATVEAGDVTLSADVDDPSSDTVDAAFYEGLRPDLDSAGVRASSGTVIDAASTERQEATVLTAEDVEAMSTLDGVSSAVESSSQFPYQMFEVDVPADSVDGSEVRLQWDGSAEEDAQVALYALRADGSGWDEVDRHITGEQPSGLFNRVAAGVTRAATTEAGQESFTLAGAVDAEAYATDGTVTVLVQHSDGFAGQDFTTRESTVENAHPDDVDRSEYDFTLAWESDTQYYNEEFYDHQVAIHDYLLAERENKNIQFMFHTGDVIDEMDKLYQWQNADPEYARLDEAGLPYSILAGNHDVVLDNQVDYSTFSSYFGEDRYADKPWYGGSYEDNRGSYQLFSAGGVDFIVVAMGWDPGDAEIEWMNEVLAAHPDRVGILNLHEFMLTTGGLGPIPQRILDEVAATNPNVQMIMSGHYHDAFTRTDDFDDDGDGTPDRTVTSMLFDYQGLPEGGQGYLRMLHFDNEGERMMVRTYSPSLERYNSDEASLLAEGEDIYADQEFELSYEQLGIEPSSRVLSTDAFSAEILTDHEIGTDEDVVTPGTAETVWTDRDAGEHSWFVRVTDEFGGTETSPVMTFLAEGEDPGTEVPGDGSENPGDEDGGTGGDSEPTPGSGNEGTAGGDVAPGRETGQDTGSNDGHGGNGETGVVDEVDTGASDDRRGTGTPDRGEATLASTGVSGGLVWLLGGGLLALGLGTVLVIRQSRSRNI
ncbi:lamin tail domain-containing protein [Citricoccus parietis]|uniref:Lamin tail domain-containing protein n=1 Tax=Citricoccus parietis TaxID=592307 RepID=A0ABV6F221_9MICC